MPRQLADTEETTSHTTRTRRTVPVEESSSQRRRREAVTEDTGRRQAPPSGLVGHGFSSYKSRAQDSDLAYRRFDVEEDDQKLIKFLESEPFAHFYRHWLPVEGKRRPFVCVNAEDVSCPLCGLGDTAKIVLFFNVVDLTDGGKVKVWEATRDPAKKIEKRYDEMKAKNKSLDDDDLYFAVGKSQQANKFNSYSLDIVKARDLEEDWDEVPLSVKELADAKKQAYTDDIVFIMSVTDLREIADKVTD